MAWYRRYRRSYRRPIRRVSRFNRQSRRFSRNMLSAIQQRDIGRFTIKIRTPIIITVPGGSQYAAVIMNIWSLLATDPQFTALKALFDQVKINGVRIAATSIVQPATSSTLLPTYVYAWDRNGAEGLGTGQETYRRVASYGSSRLQSITSGTHNSFVTSLAAQDLQERITYISTDDMGSVADGSELAQSFFKPTFLLCVQQPVTVAGTDYEYRWETDIAVDITFRGVKYSG